VADGLSEAVQERIPIILREEAIFSP